MLALTLQNHHAACVRLLGKSIENRTWKPGRIQLVRGDWFALHAGRPPVGMARDGCTTWLQQMARERCPGFDFDVVDPDLIFATGVVAVCRFGGTVVASDSPWFTGPIGWVLDEVFALPEPVACPGRQKLWTLDDEVYRAVRAQYGSAVRAEREQMEMFTP